MVSIKRQHVLYIAMSAMVAAFVLMMICRPVFATTDTVTNALGEIINVAFKALQSIFAAVAAFVILIRLFNILTGGARAVEAGVGHIKTAIICLIGAWLVVPLVQTIKDAASTAAGASDPSSLIGN